MFIEGAAYAWMGGRVWEHADRDRVYAYREHDWMGVSRTCPSRFGHMLFIRGHDWMGALRTCPSRSTLCSWGRHVSMMGVSRTWPVAIGHMFIRAMFWWEVSRTCPSRLAICLSRACFDGILGTCPSRSAICLSRAWLDGSLENTPFGINYMFIWGMVWWESQEPARRDRPYVYLQHAWMGVS